MRSHEHSCFFLPDALVGWHNEDAWKASETFPVYAVADGVTQSLLKELVLPTGPKLVADLCCAEVIAFLEKRYNDISADILKDAYVSANGAIKRLNVERRETAATVASVVAVKDGRVFGSRLTDCGFALMRKGKIAFKTPEFWALAKREHREGYGKLDGETDVRPWVDVYELVYEKGETLTLFSDGFEQHFGVKEFLDCFAKKLRKSFGR